MDEAIDLRQYVRALVRWRWLILGMTLVGGLIGLATVMLERPTFEAAALVVAAKHADKLQFDPRIQTVRDTRATFLAYAQLALSDDVVQALHTQLDPLPKGVDTPARLREMLKATQGADPSVLRMAARAQDSREATRIANAWASTFVAWANKVYGPASEESLHLLEVQLGQAQAELAKSEQAFSEFQGRNEAPILEARRASMLQDLSDYLAEQRELERVVEKARVLRDRAVDRPSTAQVSLGDDVAALLLQAQAFGTHVSAPGLPLAAGEVQNSIQIQLQVSGAAVASTGKAGDLVSALDTLATALEGRQQKIQSRTEAWEPQIAALQRQISESDAERARLDQARTVARETCLALARKTEETRIAAKDTEGELILASRAGMANPATSHRLIRVSLVALLGLLLSVVGAIVAEWWLAGMPSRSEQAGAEANAIGPRADL